jgi:hypothetical protein
MTTISHKKLWTSVFKIPPKEAKFCRRGFRITQSHIVKHLENVGENFLYGYHHALSSKNTSILAMELNIIPPLYRGFAFEGAAMGLALLDSVLPLRRKLFPQFLQGAGSPHAYMLHVGVGWAFARIPWIRRRIVRHISTHDPLLKWLIVDGYGFHEGYFYPGKYFRSTDRLGKLTGYAARAFAQGLGRSLWFVEGADTGKIPQTLSRLPASFHSDLWSGVGLACAYAGGVEENEIKRLKASAGEYLPHLAQGVAFAAKARERAQNPADHTETACRIICDCSSREAALVTDKHLEDLPPETDIPSYEIWRQRVQQEFQT